MRKPLGMMLCSLADFKKVKWWRILVCFVFKMCSSLMVVVVVCCGALVLDVTVLGAGLGVDVSVVVAGGFGILLLGDCDKMTGDSGFVVGAGD